MFELEPAIARWRRELTAAGFRSPDLLDELESHLRDDVEQRVNAGREAATAFAAAVQQIGPAGRLKPEFDKINRNQTMKRILILSAGVIGVLVGLAFILPAVHLWRTEGTLGGTNLALLLLGLALTLGGGGAAVLGAKRQRA